MWEIDFVNAMSETTEPQAAAGLHNRAVDSHGVSLRKPPSTFRSKDYQRDVPLSTADQLQYDLVCYTRFLYLNAILIEAPLTILEAVCRIVVMVFIGLIRLVFLLCRRKCRKAFYSAWQYLREVVLIAAAILSLAIPGLILAVYWEYSHEDEWELRPLPTVVGGVDMRRFAVVSFGGGAQARNVTVTSARDAATAEEEQETAALYPVGRNQPHLKPRKTTAKTALSRIGELNQDSWKGALMWVPREVLADCAALLDGGDRLESMDVVL